MAGCFPPKLGASPGTKLVPRKVQVNGVGPQSRPAAGIRHPRLLSPRTWINTQVALAKARSSRVSLSRNILPRSSPSRPNRCGYQPRLCNKAVWVFAVLSRDYRIAGIFISADDFPAKSGVSTRATTSVGAFELGVGW